MVDLDGCHAALKQIGDRAMRPLYDDEREVILMFALGCAMIFAFGMSRPSEDAICLFGLAYWFVSFGLLVWWFRFGVPSALQKMPALLIGIIVGAGIFDRLVHG